MTSRPLAALRWLLKSRFVRFALVGVGNTAVDAGVLAVLTGRFGFDPYGARVISFLVAVTFGFALNRWLTFSGQGGHIASQWSRFVASQSVGIAVNYGIYAALVATTSMVAAHPTLGVLAGAVAGLFFNYFAAAHFVFHDKHLPDSADKKI